MLFRVDPESDAPLHRQVSNSVRTGLATGKIVPGDRLPSARDVAAGLEINVHTVLRAYQDLRDEGLLELHRGRGAIVTPTAMALMVLHKEVVQLTQKARSLGISSETVAALIQEVDHHSSTA